MFTQKQVNSIAYEIVGCAIEVHRELGPGLLENVYEWCLLEELERQGFEVHAQVQVPILYKGKSIPHPLRIDLLVEQIVIVEIKAVENILPVHEAQLLSYLKLCNKPKGLLINFHCNNIVQKGLIPLVTEQFTLLKKE
ncbi:MAG: GxxExxY protein [Saprospiraceae bacterium]